MEAHHDSAVVPWVCQVEVSNALGKAVVRGKLSLTRVLEIWEELLLLPIRQVAIGNSPQLLLSRRTEVHRVDIIRFVGE